jgi:P4 family phage/plasmid primase-like protien
MATKNSVGPFKTMATQYRDVGFNPVPIKPGSKSPAPSQWQTGRKEDDTFNAWLTNYPDHGVGILLGTPLEAVLTGGADLREQYLIAIDVDCEEMAEPVRHALRVHATQMCAKRGRKGITIFARGDAEQKNKKITKREEDGKRNTLVEILAAGSQTVIPPTVHPDTNKPYEWVGVDLLHVRMRDLPEITESVMEEILAVCEGGIRAQHFQDLNNMVWAGVGGGGNTHDTCVGAVASMVARGWKDTQIHERIEFAKEEACIRAGLPYDWPGSARAIQEWIDSARKKGMDEAQGDKKMAQDRVAALWLIEQYGGAESLRFLGKMLQYRDGHWGESDEPRMMERKILEHFTGFNALRARSAVDTATSLVWDNNFGHSDHARFMVCTPEGTLDCRTLSIERHAPEHELLYSARAKYDPAATCSRYLSFVHAMLGGDQEKIALLEEYLGWTFVQDTSFEKVLFLVGKSGIGKTTMMRVLEGLHSKRACSYVAPHDISEPTARAGLVGKLVNISSEKSRMKSISDDYLKKIVSGETIETRRLYQDYVPVRLFVRFINTVNDMPDMADYSDGLARRLLIVVCQDPVMPEKPDVNHPTVLLQERDGIFTRWMQALHRLIERGGFDVPASVTSDVQAYIGESSLTAIWIRERCVALTAAEADRCMSSNDLYQDYAVWIESRVGGERWKHLSLITWGKEMKTLGYPSVNVWRGGTAIKARRLRLKATRRPTPADASQEPDY